MVSIVKKTRRIVPLYLQTAEQLRSRILNGVYPKGSALPSESELAASFGINHITLRKGLRVLADQNLIVQQHGRGTFVTYAPEENLRIGLVVDAVGGSNSRYFLWMISELTRQLGELNGNVILLPTRNVSEKELMDRFHKNRCNGLLISNAHEKLAAVLCNPEFDYIPTCFINNREYWFGGKKRCVIGLKSGAISKAVAYLKSLGHRRIAYISADVPDDLVLKERNQDFLQCDIPEPVCRLGVRNVIWYDWARQTMHEFAAMDPRYRPTAVICAGQAFAIGSWVGAAAAGLRIPDDISIIGFDADPGSIPWMSSLEQPMEKFIRKAVELFQTAQISGGILKPDFYEFEAEVCDRGSCKTI